MDLGFINKFTEALKSIPDGLEEGFKKIFHFITDKID
jgi:hypothetical protein